MILNCVIIDDVPLAIDVIESYLKKVEGVKIVAKCTNSIEALNILSNQNIDLVFLDIQMPNLSGLELINTLNTNHPPQFILTTAYPQYALDGFDLNVTDYLVKPIDFKRFFKSFTRAQELHKLKLQKGNSNIIESHVPNKYIFVKHEYENVKINTEQITYIDGLGEYIKIHTSQFIKPVLTLMSFKGVLDKLSNPNFIRVHRSYIINIDKIDVLQKTKIIIDKKRIPIGETYKKSVMNKLGL
ncbi:LytR/AlgR family response regulator transcription factor [Tenacibaculum ovolyticum]|uniref:LytR/AlgR family response regulator transcription factor n=1 Tax=Tenacibaculum ovolyticum TaxID=104270 RepID=UPI003BAD4988